MMQTIEKLKVYKHLEQEHTLCSTTIRTYIKTSQHAISKK